MANVSRPADGQPIATRWGQWVHDIAENLAVDGAVAKLVTVGSRTSDANGWLGFQPAEVGLSRIDGFVCLAVMSASGDALTVFSAHSAAYGWMVALMHIGPGGTTFSLAANVTITSLTLLVVGAPA